MDKVKPIGRRLKQLRQERGLVQKDFAPQVGLGVSTLRKAENQDFPIDRRRLEEIANKLGVALSEVMQHSVTTPPVSLDEFEVEVRPVNSAALLDYMRFASHLHHETHIDVTKAMVKPIETILKIAKLFSRNDGFPRSERIAEFNPDWADFPELHAAAELNEAIQQLRDMKVVVLANSKYVQFESLKPRTTKYLGISFDPEGMASRLINLVPF